MTAAEELAKAAREIIRSCEEMAASRGAPVITAIDAADALRPVLERFDREAPVREAEREMLKQAESVGKHRKYRDGVIALGDDASEEWYWEEIQRLDRLAVAYAKLLAARAAAGKGETGKETP